MNRRLYGRHNEGHYRRNRRHCRRNRGHWRHNNWWHGDHRLGHGWRDRRRLFRPSEQRLEAATGGTGATASGIRGLVGLGQEAPANVRGFHLTVVQTTTLTERINDEMPAPRTTAAALIRLEDLDRRGFIRL